MNLYEHTIVAKQELSSVDFDKIENKYKDIINNASGKVIKIEKWGLISLARKIKNYNKGFFIHYKFEGNSKTLDEIKKNINIDGSVLRHLTIKYKKLNLDKEYFKKDSSEDEKKK
jgi:small subunit ribosomal protein S6